MEEKYLRVYRKVLIDDVKEHLLVCGELTGACSKCNAIGIKTDAKMCPECGTEFRYLAFRNIQGNVHKIPRLSEQNPGVTFIDFDDYKKLTGSTKAQDFFK